MPQLLDLLLNIVKTNQILISKCYNNARINCSFSSRSYCQASVKCWSCGTTKSSAFELFCDKCSVIQAPHDKNNYFKLIGIEQKYDVDLKALTQKFREMQSLLHPDKYSNKTDAEKDISQEYSSVLNRAYSMLQSPINRGLHLLALNGEQINEDDNETKDRQFLSDIMELNEEIEDANSDDELLALNKKNRETLKNISDELSSAFQQSDIQNAKKILIKMKYYMSIAVQINHLLRERGVVE